MADSNLVSEYDPRSGLHPPFKKQPVVVLRFVDSGKTDGRVQSLFRLVADAEVRRLYLGESFAL